MIKTTILALAILLILPFPSKAGSLIKSEKMVPAGFIQKALRDRQDNSDEDVNNNGDWDFRTETVHDDQTGEDAFSIDVPEDWDFDAEIEWYLDELPVYTVFIAIGEPDGTSGLALLPLASYVWFSDPWLQRQMPEGTRYNDSTIVMQPMDADDYIVELLIPYLQDIYHDEARIRNFEIIDIQNRRDLVDDYIAYTGLDTLADYYDFTGAEASVEYTRDGVAIEEKISVVVGESDNSFFGVGSFSMETQTNWIAFLSVLQRAPLGELDEMEDIYGDILLSIQWEEDFFEEFQDMQDEWREEHEDDFEYEYDYDE